MPELGDGAAPSSPTTSPARRPWPFGRAMTSATSGSSPTPISTAACSREAGTRIHGRRRALGLLHRDSSTGVARPTGALDVAPSGRPRTPACSSISPRGAARSTASPSWPASGSPRAPTSTTAPRPSRRQTSTTSSRPACSRRPCREPSGGLGLGPLCGDAFGLWMMTKEIAKADLSLARCWEGHANSLVLIDALGTEEQKRALVRRRGRARREVGRLERRAAGEEARREAPVRHRRERGRRRLDGHGSKVFATSATGADWAILLVNPAGPRRRAPRRRRRRATC